MLKNSNGGVKVEIETIIEAAKNGDKKAFEIIVKRYHNELYYTALGIVRSGWEALDICQETFIKAFNSINRLKDTTKFKSWINRILINKCNDYFRKNKKVVYVDFIEESEGFIEGGCEENIDLLRALSTLKDDSRVVLTLRYFQDLPLKEIATILDIPEGTVKSRISNGLKEMRKLMKTPYEEEGKI
ncbi:sigma-70 family RNA polymerase sigma factor [Herbivorax sp. ANBcel31]|uniref:RNA polymerase sigma factor n=1 Tax=Herbivorax sp. ANBcel31 TaxID=3069754 RepID=UPI0027B5504C|nr:sigma-70 family RNA polymerase sigma factor [Herbivorax sp. ANBcel31]MDQ2086290.1 sigma-70 family RNA polymerase sigma factor [Herbivorax sp. ANBcel31]